MALLKDWFGWEGPYTAQQRRTETQHKMSMKQMQSLIDSRFNMDALRKVQVDMLKEGRTIYGSYGRGKTATNPMVKAGKLADAVSKMDGAGFFDDNEELKESLTAYALKDLPGADYKKPMDTKVNLAELLSHNLEGIPQNVDRKGWFWNLGDDVISKEARDNAIKKSVNELVRKHGYSREQAASVIQDEINSKMGREKGRIWRTLPEGPVDVRGMFSGGISPFETAEPELEMPQVGDALTYDRRTAKPTSILTEEGMKPLADYFQAGTETVPEENIPPTFEQLGVEQADQESFQQLEKKLPDIDLRQTYRLDPQGFKQMLTWLRNGKTPNGKPFTIKDAIKMLQAFQG